MTFIEAQESAKDKAIADNTRMAIWEEKTKRGNKRFVVRDDRSSAPFGPFTFCGSVSSKGVFSK